MIFTRSPIPMLTESVITDIVTRSGEATETSTTPYRGMREEIILKHIQKEDKSTVIRLLAESTDFNADHCKPPFNTPYSEELAKAQKRVTEGYARNLEDIHVSWIIKYIENLLYSVRNYDTNSTKSIHKKNKFTRQLVDQEDGEIINETELTLNDYSCKGSNMYKLKDRLIESILRLYRCGAELKVSMFSILIIQEKLLHYNNALRRKSFQYLGIYKQGINCSLGDIITNAYAENVETALAIAQDNAPDYDVYCKACKTFCYCLKELGVEIYKQDFKIFTKDLYEKLLAQYISTTKPNFEKVLNEISFESKSAGNSYYALVPKKINQFRAAIIAKKEVAKKTLDCIYFCNTMSAYSQKSTNRPASPLRFKDTYKFGSGGFLFDAKYGNIALFNVSDISLKEYDTRKRAAILHETGYLILLDSDENHLKVLNACDAEKQYALLLKGQSVAAYHRGNNVQFGVWDIVLC